MNVRNRLLTILALVLSTSCMVEKGEVNIKLPGAKNFRHSEITKATVTNVQIINDQLVITGTNLNVVTNIKTENASKSFSESFTIESKTSSQIIANSNSPLSFAVNSLFNLVLSNSYGAATFQINFSLCDATINGKGINCSVVANDKDVLSYDSVSDTWRPRQVNGLNYLGTFDASPGIAPTAQPSGSYYVISVSGTIGAINFDVGDWIVSNGSAYQKIDNSTAIISVFGRTGAVTGVEGDYSLDLLSDVDLITTPPTAGKILKYNGTQWVVSDDLSSGGAGSVSSSEIADGTIATADLANASVTDAKINSVAASKITGTVNGTQVGTGVITNSHIAAGAAIDYSKLNITNNTIPYAHVNVGVGEIAQDRIAGFSTALSNLLTGTITNGDATHAPTGDAVFDALGLKLNLTGGTLSMGTINGVPTPVNGDDIVNKAYVDSAVTGATTTANDKVSKTGDTMTGALVLPSNGLIVGTNQLTVSGGNVGIGTTSPTTKLQVSSSSGSVTSTIERPAGNFGLVQIATTGSGRRWELGADSGAESGSDAGSNLGLWAYGDGGAQTQVVSVTRANGNVGIGTTIPSQKLDVVGNINATQLCIAGDCKSAWPTGLGANSVTSTEITDGSIMNADINAAAAIAQSKISGLTTDLSNKQPLDAGLTNLSTYNTNGILVQSADNTFVGRSLAGTANRLDVTNGDGVSGNPTLNINPTLLPSPTASGYFLKSTGADASVWSLLSSGDITSALGFTPVNKSGDTISTGTIAFNAIGTLSLGYTPTNLTDATSKSYVDNLVATAANQWTESSGNIYRNSGNVGIGTTAPLSNLTIGSNIPGQNNSGSDIVYSALTFQNSASNFRVAEIKAIQPNTHFQDAGALGFFTGYATSSERMRIDPLGNVGIGTTAPNTKLELAVNTSQAVNQTTLFTLKNASGDYDGNNGPAMEFANNIGLAKIAGVDERAHGADEYRGALVFKTRKHTAGTDSGYYERMRINYLGNLGIGTTTPQFKLHVGGSSAGGADQTVAQIGDVNAAGSGPLYLTYNAPMLSGNTYFNTGWKYAGGSAKPASIGLAGGISFNTSNNAVGAAGSAVTDMNTSMLITPSGNVGIGTTTPLRKLDIAGSFRSVAPYAGYANAALYSHSGGYGQLEIFNDSSATDVSFLSFHSGGNIGWQQGIQGSSFVISQTSGPEKTNNDVERFTITNTGNVGIGTTSPSRTLYVNGTSGGSNAWENLSDKRLKRNIATVDNALEKILQIDGVEYFWNKDAHSLFNVSKRKELGVIAQDVEKQFPEVVKTDDKGIKSVAYTMLISPMIEAIKSLYYDHIEVLWKNVNEHERNIASLKNENHQIKKDLDQMKKENRELRSAICEINPKSKVCR